MTKETLSLVYSAIKQKKRVPDIEEKIISCPVSCFLYAKEVIKGEWLPAEKSIAEANLNIFAQKPQNDEFKTINMHLYLAYASFVGKRCFLIEETLKKNKYYGFSYRYCKLIYKKTKELIDLDSPEVCAWILDDIKKEKFAKRLSKEDKLDICLNLHNRMILYSFTNQNKKIIRQYFRYQKILEKETAILLSQFEGSETVASVIKKLTK